MASRRWRIRIRIRVWIFVIDIEINGRRSNNGGSSQSIALDEMRRALEMNNGMIGNHRVDMTTLSVAGDVIGR